MLSQGGKDVYLKTVALALFMYAMSCFKLPFTLYIELKRLMAKFWWVQKVEKKKIHWVGWNKMCTPKFHGGLGFKELNLFN